MIMTDKRTIPHIIGSTRLGWSTCFSIWCVYWWVCVKFNKGVHFDRTYWLFGRLRSKFLNIGAEAHPTWGQRRHYYARRWRFAEQKPSNVVSKARCITA